MANIRALKNTAPSDALKRSKVHPGYSADYTPATNYTKGRHAGRSPEQIVEELNALYVLNENKNPSIARSWKMSRDFASKMIPYYRASEKLPNRY